MKPGKVETVLSHVEDPKLDTNFSPIIIWIGGRQRMALDTGVGEYIGRFRLEVRIPEGARSVRTGVP